MTPREIEDYAWKEKNLDYEIETVSVVDTPSFCLSYLKRKEPRLRDWNNTVAAPILLLALTWKEKNLDYEIETHHQFKQSRPVVFPWKEKNLDYEIETPFMICFAK